MKKYPLLFSAIAIILVSISCRHKYYTASLFEEQTKDHEIIAIMPAEMIFTGKQPKELTAEDIKKIEEQESTSFQYALYNSILQYANTTRYESTISFKDINSTLKILEDNNITVRDSWRKDDIELAQLLGVDAIVRMRIQKQRYMSDIASYGVDVARRVMNQTGIYSKLPLPIPGSLGKTNDIYANCSIVSKNRALWNDSYKYASDWNNPANVLIENITDNFGAHFPYKRRRGR